MRSVILQKEYNVGDIFYYGFMSDMHLDAPDHDRDRLIEDLEFFKEHNADIFIGGDNWSMLMNGDRKRYTPSQARYPGEDAHINHAINEAVDVLTPYAHLIKVMLSGNHEETTLKFHGIDPTAALIDRLNEKTGSSIEYLGYQGFIRLSYKYANGNETRMVDIKAHHGAGGAAEVSKGTITEQRFIHSNIADIYWNGHTHYSLVMPCDNAAYLDNKGVPRARTRLALVSAPYVHVVSHESTKRGNHARPMKVNYGNRMRTYVSTGGHMVYHIFNGKSADTMRQKTIC